MIVQLYLPAVAVMIGLVLIWRTVAMTETAAIDLEDLDDPRNAVRQMELETSIRDRVLSPLSTAFADRIRKVTPTSRLEAVQKKLVLAGLENGRLTPEAVLGAKLFSTLIGMLLAGAVLSKGFGTGALMQAALAVGVGYMVPETLLTRKVNDRQKLIENDLPDMIDQITVTVEAGLSFDGAIQRAGEEGSGPLAEEFLKVVNDMQIGMTREEALSALLERTSVPSLRGFVLSIRQASRYGLPIAKVLRVQSNEMREKRRARAEEKAMQIPVKITFPLVFCILPALFLVILGPAAIQISQQII